MNTGDPTAFGAPPSSGQGAFIPIAQIATGTPTGSKFVRDDGVLAVPSAVVAAPFTGDQATGSFTIATGKFGLHGYRLILVSTDQAVLEGTSRLIISG